jgi:Flp pilus assembly protein TadD
VGFHLLQSGAFDKAETVVQGLAELRPAEPAAHLLAGMLAFARERFPDAEKSYRRILAIDPFNDLGRAFLAESLIAQRRWREAEALLGQVELSARDPQAARFAADLTLGLRQGIFQQAARA